MTGHQSIGSDGDDGWVVTEPCVELGSGGQDVAVRRQRDYRAVCVANIVDEFERRANLSPPMEPKLERGERGVLDEDLHRHHANPRSGRGEHRYRDAEL